MTRAENYKIHLNLSPKYVETTDTVYIGGVCRGSSVEAGVVVRQSDVLNH